MQTLGEYHKTLLEIKNIVTEIKNASDGLISRLNTGKERKHIWGYDNGNFPSEMQREKKIVEKME